MRWDKAHVGDVSQTTGEANAALKAWPTEPDAVPSEEPKAEEPKAEATTISTRRSSTSSTSS